MNAFRRYIAFVAFLLVMLALAAGLAIVGIDPARALLFGFDAGVMVFLTILIVRFGADEADAMRRRAKDNEPDFHFLVIIALIIIAVVLVAVWVELTGKGGRHGTGIALSVVTLFLAWLFANTLFALHYAHRWYLPHGKADRRGLDFPGKDPTPDYWDFAYFAFVLGMTFQVSDVEITDKYLRRLSLIHALLAFLFNIGVVALSVSLVASAVGG